MSSSALEDFQDAVLAFYESEGRDLPWRTTTDVYRILVSEVMLQQTHVDRVLPKYLAWLERFPDASSLASASQRDVLSAWQGLGYNRRALWLQEAAGVLAQNPKPSLEGLRALKGVGDYTAAAVCAFAYNMDVAAIDVNVRRVFSRYFGAVDDAFIASAVPSGQSRDWHNALMDFGATRCTKRSPRCDACPLSSGCHALAHDTFSSEPSSSQPRFVGSVRWHRGQVLKAVLSRPRSREQVWAVLDGKHRDPEKFSAAVQQLVDEGFLSEDKGFLAVSGSGC